MDPDPTPALCAGTLDQMIDQVTRSVAFVQRKYPCNEWVSLQIFLLSDNAGGRWVRCLGSSPAASSGLWSRRQIGSLWYRSDALRKLKADLALFSDPPQGTLPLWTLSRGPPGCHDAPGQLDKARSHTQPQRFSRDCSLAGQPSPSSGGPHRLPQIPAATEGLTCGL